MYNKIEIDSKIIKESHYDIHWNHSFIIFFNKFDQL